MVLEVSRELEQKSFITCTRKASEVAVKTSHLLLQVYKVPGALSAPTGTTGTANRDVNNAVSIAVLLVG